jgi:hypothetical protein
MAGVSGGAARHVSLTLAAGANAPAIERGDVHAPEMKRTTSQLARHAASEHDERVPLRPSAAQVTEKEAVSPCRWQKLCGASRRETAPPRGGAAHVALSKSSARKASGVAGSSARERSPPPAEAYVAAAAVRAKKRASILFS